MKRLQTPSLQILLLIASLCSFIPGAKAQPQDLAGIRQANAINALTIEVTRYLGDCPGQALSRPKVHFVSPTAPRRNRRVRIYNRSLIGENTPYTDREYETKSDNPYLRNWASEFFYITRLNEHSNRALALVEGENQMVAIIYDGGRRSFPDQTGYREIKVYEFTVDLTLHSTRQERNLITSNPSLECDDPDTSLASCAEQDKVKVRYTYCQGSSPQSGEREVIRYLYPRRRDDCD